MQALIEGLTLLVAALALFVSILAVWLSTRASGHQTELQRRLVALEDARDRDRLRDAKRAHVRAEIVRDGRSYLLIVANDGPGTARGLKTLLDAQPCLEHPLAIRSQQEVSRLGPGARAEYHLAVMMGSPRKVHARVMWEDDTGEAGAWESELTF